MNERLSRQRPRGVSAAALRNWGIVFLAAGIVGRSILQNAILDMGNVSAMALLTAMQNDSTTMVIATVALVCQAMETCAAPLFSFLLVEGFVHTSDFRKYLTRVGLLALVTELPYNLAMSAKFFDTESRNPVFGLFICLVMLFFFSRYQEKGLKNLGMKALVFVASFLWCIMLGIDQGVCLVVMVGVIWAFRNKGTMRAMFGFCSAMICSLFDLFYMVATMSFIFLHLYNGEKGDQNRAFSYAVYPAMLLVFGIAAMFLK